MDHRHWLALSRTPRMGVVTVRRCLEFFSSVEKIFSATTAELQAAGLTPLQRNLLKKIDWQQVDNDLLWLEKNNSRLLTWDDADYPPLLREIYDPPYVIYVQGDVALLSKRQMAIVGTRNPSAAARTLARQFAKELAAGGVVITSGLALGIDAASHEGALDAGRPTIAVVGTGLKSVYPREHDKLAARIVAEGGALVSEFPLDMPPKAIHFPMRNRIISGLSVGVLVVEAAVRSGSLITARLALEQNRDVFAIPGSIHNPLARGCHQLIRQGARLVETAQDILEEIHLPVRPFSALPEKEAVDLDPELQRVLTQIGYEVTALDVIILRSQLTAAEVSSMLLPLELEGYVRVVPGGYVRV